MCFTCWGSRPRSGSPKSYLCHIPGHILVHLREFVYSRHPDPRRVWKGGSEQHLLTPLPRAPGVPRASSKKLYVVVFYNVFEKCLFQFSVKGYMLLCLQRFWHNNFSYFLWKAICCCVLQWFFYICSSHFLWNLEDGRRQSKVAKGTPRTAKGIANESQWEPKGVRKEAKGTPDAHKGSHKCSETAKWSPRASQREPKGVQGCSEATPWHPKDTQGKPAGPDQPPQRTLC